MSFSNAAAATRERDAASSSNSDSSFSVAPSDAQAARAAGAHDPSEGTVTSASPAHDGPSSDSAAAPVSGGKDNTRTPASRERDAALSGITGASGDSHAAHAMRSGGLFERPVSEEETAAMIIDTLLAHGAAAPEPVFHVMERAKLEKEHADIRARLRRADDTQWAWFREAHTVGLAAIEMGAIARGIASDSPEAVASCSPVAARASVGLSCSTAELYSRLSMLSLSADRQSSRSSPVAFSPPAGVSTPGPPAARGAVRLPLASTGAIERLLARAMTRPPNGPCLTPNGPSQTPTEPARLPTRSRDRSRDAE